MPVYNSSAWPSIINVTEAVRLCAFAPPSSSLDRHTVGVFPQSVNIPGYPPLTGGMKTTSSKFLRTQSDFT